MTTAMYGGIRDTGWELHAERARGCLTARKSTASDVHTYVYGCASARSFFGKDQRELQTFILYLLLRQGFSNMDGCVCVLSRFLLHVVILELLELALFNDTVARVSRKHSHGVCMRKCTSCTASVLVCTHVTPYPSSPMLTVSPGISRKHFVQNRYLHAYTHTDRK